MLFVGKIGYEWVIKLYEHSENNLATKGQFQNPHFPQVAKLTQVKSVPKMNRCKFEGGSQDSTRRYQDMCNDWDTSIITCYIAQYAPSLCDTSTLCPHPIDGSYSLIMDQSVSVTQLVVAHKHQIVLFRTSKL